jgi:hypothetical protein
MPVPPTYLQKKHPHERDSHITFDEGPHIYTIDGDSDYTSVTTFCHSLFEKFDADKIITKMMNSRKWEQSKYFGMTREEIKAQWSENGRVASEAGTKMHYDIECYYNKIPTENDSVEYGYFKQFVAAFPELIPYRTEWMIYHEELKLAGSVDMVYRDATGNLLIYDWKRCKEIVKVPKFMKYSHHPLVEYIIDSNYWHYCLQLNVYKWILQAKYGATVGDLYLVCLHPNNANGSFQRIKVADLQEEVEALFNDRLKSI